jgi:methyl-accepting chemotaxis protein
MVRNLAQRSAQAAKDTAALIAVKTLVDEGNLDSQEQPQGIQQISRAVAEMDLVTQSTAASAEQSASASEELSA